MNNIVKKTCALFAVLFSIMNCSSGQDIRPPSHAGTFYPSGHDDLRKTIDDFLRRVTIEVKGSPRAVIVPHAGYVYSGETAAYAYSVLKDRDIGRVILLSTSHYAYLDGVVVNHQAYRTPLGVYPVDRSALAILEKESFHRITNSIASTREHSDEVQVPFLQRVAPHAKLVSVIVGELTDRDLTETARALNKIIDDRTVVVVSSDFTHYGNNFDYTPPFIDKSVREGVAELDSEAIEFITNCDSRGFIGYVRKKQATICGANPISLLLRILEQRNSTRKGNLLKYTMSGEMTNDFSNTVSYAAILFGDITSIREKPSQKPVIDKKLVGPEEEKTLLALSRFVLTEFVEKGVTNFPDSKIGSFTITGGLKQNLGVFVTLTKQKELRGCIGFITGQGELYCSVISVTMKSASEDPRFLPVARNELSDIDIEISVMTPLVKAGSPDEIKVGRDGVYLTNGNNAGVFLPQVPLEWGWDRKTYLEELGHKAGLSSDAYKDRNTVLYKFSAQVFGEK